MLYKGNWKVWEEGDGEASDTGGPGHRQGGVTEPLKEACLRTRGVILDTRGARIKPGHQDSLHRVSLRRVKNEGHVPAGRFSACQARVENIRSLETGLGSVAQIQPLEMGRGSRWATM
ncbi:hypothetical protein VNO78_07858 [Psophocarpus tetragonolobus]|uniref:Uncharacterized protein n=1 Tax=Psophocarpus tetragonolobus TaxID=3891 RepID=A0AAN9XS20_PSOTE